MMAPEDLLAAQQQIHDQIADGMPLETIVTTVCALGEQVLPDAVVSVMLHDATTDIRTSSDWSPYAELAECEGFRACWSTPILGREDTLLGTFAVYYHETREPSTRDLKLLHGLNRLLAVAIRLNQEQNESRLLQRGIDASPTGILLVDACQADMPVVYVNRGFERLTGYSRDEALGRNCRFLQGADTSPEARVQLRRALQQQEEACVLLRNYRRDGSAFWNELTVGPVFDDAGVCTHFFGIQHDISRQIDSENQLALASTHDTLTRLLNRAGFENELPAVCSDSAQRGRVVGLLYLDVDGFSPVNDALGRGIGDLLLGQVAKRLTALLPKGGLVARFEADEFVLALPDCAYEQRVDEHAERVLSAMSEPFVVAGHDLHVSASLGATICQSLVDADFSAIQRANLALRHAKESGRNNWQWYGENMQGSREYIELRRDIQLALDTDAFCIHYQPLVNARNGEVRTVEALIRWPGPNGEMISPGRFIPVAESTGQIIVIGRWVLFGACEDIAQFNQRTGRKVAVAVNISPLQFRRPGFVDDVVLALEYSGLEPRLLQLEVTEGVLMRSTDEVMETLQLIRALGVRVVIDDFGTGFSSLSYLRDLPITRLKIDRSFINDMLTSSGSSAIVEGVITMAHRLGLLVVAEGVETQEQRQELVRLNCDLLQGFLFSPAVPLSELKDDYWHG